MFRIDKIYFQKAAEEIVKNYPNEKATIYFIRAKPKTKSRNDENYNEVKLWNIYHTVQKALIGFTEENDERDYYNKEVNDGVYFTIYYF